MTITPAAPSAAERAVGRSHGDDVQDAAIRLASELEAVPSTSHRPVPVATDAAEAQRILAEQASERRVLLARLRSR